MKTHYRNHVMMYCCTWSLSLTIWITILRVGVASQSVTTGSRCISSCVTDGDYQSCDTCHSYVRCSQGSLYIVHCSDPIDPNLFWDDVSKNCFVSNSTTCTQPPPSNTTGAASACPTGAVGITSCANKTDGKYQACDTCHCFTYCTGGVGTKTGCSNPINPLLFWDQGSQQCLWTSTTCTEPISNVTTTGAGLQSMMYEDEVLPTVAYNSSETTSHALECARRCVAGTGCHGFALLRNKLPIYVTCALYLDSFQAVQKSSNWTTYFN